MSQLSSYGDIVVIDSRFNRERSIGDDLVEPVQKLLKQDDYFYINRVIGRPGDTLEIKNGVIFRNGQKQSSVLKQ